MTTASSGVPEVSGGDPSPEAEVEVEVPDEQHRRIARPDPDGRTVEVLAAPRGVAMRPGAVSAAGGTGTHLNPLSMLMGLVIDLVVSIVATVLVELAAEGRPWKVKVYRRRRFFIQRLHAEVLPRGVEPEARMLELLDVHAPIG